MLTRIGREEHTEGAKVMIRDAHFPAPFKQGLEYSSPARGTWNIVHTGMLIPESHQIFVCAQGCLRGVVLTAAEMDAMDRYSSVMIREENVIDGTMETLMIDGVTDVLHKLNYRPKAVLLFISCQHFFLAYDQSLVFDTLRERFPEIHFMDCYMIPTLRKSGLTPDQKMRLQLFSLLEPMEKDSKKINLIGSNLPISITSELVRLLNQNGYKLQLLNWCETFEDYMDMAESFFNLVYEPIGIPAAQDLEKRLGQQYRYLPFVFDFEQLERNYHKLTDDLGIERQNYKAYIEEAQTALKSAKQLIGDTYIAVDYTFTFRIMSFTKMLLLYGFCVTEVYADVFLPEEQADFDWIRQNYPDIQIISTNQPNMRYLPRNRDHKVLAIGQKAAYFTGTDYFVNVVESGGMFGFDGIRQIAELMKDAYLNEKPRKEIIQRKGYGCESCI
ncbi:MAG: nitrogenase component 1 [Lachnospiraceae bacterium]|nr:nitrogenase component 1 [Lachnospiraceae bacterium]